MRVVKNCGGVLSRFAAPDASGRRALTFGSLSVFGITARDPPTSHRVMSAADLIKLAARHNAQGNASLGYRRRLYGLVRAVEWADSIVQGSQLISALCAHPLGHLLAVNNTARESYGTGIFDNCATRQ